MARIDTLANFVTDLAIVIKNKTGRTDPITPANFDTEIESIQAGGGDTSIEDALITKTLEGEYVNDRVTEIGDSVFLSCYSLISVSLPNVTDINGYYAFCNCESLSSINLPKLERIMGNYNFSGIGATSIELPELIEIGDNDYVTGEETFAWSSFLTTVNLPKLINIPIGTFRGCSALENVSLPSAESLGESVFYSCSSLENITLPNVTTIGSYAFFSCSSLKNVDLPKLNSLTAKDVFSSCSALTTVKLSSITNIQTPKLFENCRNLRQIILPSSTMCTLSISSCFDNSGISDGVGYIYVNDDLVDSYKSADNWSEYASQIKPISELEVI